MRRPEDLLHDALLLSDEERGALALELLDSLSPPDTRSESEWMIEIERRARRVFDATSQQDRTMEEAVASIERKLAL